MTSSSRPHSTPTSATLGRRGFLGLAGALGAGALAACGGNTGRGDSGSGATGSGGKPAISQWYHAYGESGTQQAVEGYAKAYPDASVTVKWFPSGYDNTVASALLTATGPDVFENGNGPSIDMIQGKQVVALTGILGDAQSDFTPSLIERMTYQGKLYAVPQVTDMQLHGLPQEPAREGRGASRRRRSTSCIAAAKKLTTDKVKGLFVGNDGGVGVLGGPMLWSAGLDYLTRTDHRSGSTTRARRESLRQAAQLFTSGSAAARRARPTGPTRRRSPRAWPPCSGPGCGPCPRSQKAFGGRLRRHGLAGARQRRQGARSRSAPTARASAPRPRTSRRARRSSSGCGSTRPTTSWTSPSPTGSTSRRARAGAKADQALVRSGRRRGDPRQRERARAEPAAVDAEVPDRLLRRDSTGSCAAAPTRRPRSRR